MGLRSLAAELIPAALQGLQRTTFVAATLGPSAEASTFAALTDKLAYLSKSDLKLVREAYKFADEAHLGQFRASGQPYITHPIAVAGLCADWKLDAQGIMAALLHDTIEDQGVTKTELIEKFGAPTADLVDGLTKLDKLHFSTREENQAESFRKMLLAMSRDVRVILIKLADRLHNMRTLQAMAASKRARIARETLEIYAPIAHRLGLNQMYRELQDLCFAMLHPWRHAALSKAVQKARGHRRDIVARIQKDVETTFSHNKLKMQVSGREKTVYSIYRKMRDKHAAFAQVSDIFGFRIVVSAPLDCYLALGLLHQLYQPVPGRFKDYIALPKPNGYQSLHTTLLSPVGTAFEVQVRTESMNAVAEAGVAAHWLYKVSDKALEKRPGKEREKGNSADEAQRLSAIWLQSLVDIQEETHDPAEFLEHVKFDLYHDAVYVFTPANKILALPRGATLVDFAYAIHTDVGQHAVAGKVNGEPAALRTALKSGDVVEIITSPSARPNPGWLAIVRTGRARSKIRHYLKNMENEESQALGERMFVQALRSEGLEPPSTAPTDVLGTTLWQLLTRWSGTRNRGELMMDIGLGRKVAVIMAKRMANFMLEKGIKPDPLLVTQGLFNNSDESASRQSLVFVDGGEGTSINFAACCRPIPGDDLVGYLGRGEGLLVHTAECNTGKRLFERDSERWMQVEWAEEMKRPFDTSLHLLVKNGKGVLAQVASAIALAEADIVHIDMDPEPADETIELRLLVSVRDRVHFAAVLRTLRRSPVVLKVSRYKPG